MALDIYFRDDIRNVLRSVYIASEGPAALIAELMRDPELQNVSVQKLLGVYREGYLQALNAVGLAFGLDREPPAPAIAQPRADLIQPVSSAAERPATNSAEPRRETELDELDMTRFLWVKRQYEQRR